MKQQHKVLSWLEKKDGFKEAKEAIEQNLEQIRTVDLEKIDLIYAVGYCLHTIYMKHADNIRMLAGDDPIDWVKNYSSWETMRKAAWEDAKWYVSRFVKE